MKIMKAAVLAMTIMGSTGAASAVEFRNYDLTNHKVKITSPSLNKEYEFRAMTLSLVICVDSCKFEVPGVGTVTANRDDIVTVQEGKITTTKAEKK